MAYSFDARKHFTPSGAELQKRADIRYVAKEVKRLRAVALNEHTRTLNVQSSWHKIQQMAINTPNKVIQPALPYLITKADSRAPAFTRRDLYIGEDAKERLRSRGLLGLKQAQSLASKLAADDMILYYKEFSDAAQRGAKRYNPTAGVHGILEILQNMQKIKATMPAGVAKNLEETYSAIVTHTMIDDLTHATLQDTMSFWEHAYLEMLQTAIQGTAFCVHLKHPSKMVGNFAKVYKEACDKFEHDTKYYAEKFADEWRSKMGTIDASTSYWFEGVNWLPKSGAKRDELTKKFRSHKHGIDVTNNGRYQGRLAQSARRPMFWGESGTLKRAVRVNKVAANHDTGDFIYEVGLDPAMMHNKYDSRGKVVALASVRQYSGRHRSSGFPTTMPFNRRVLNTLVNRPENFEESFGGMAMVKKRMLRKYDNGKERWVNTKEYGFVKDLLTTRMGKTIDQIDYEQQVRSKHSTPMNVSNPMRRHQVDTISSKIHTGQMFIWTAPRSERLKITRHKGKVTAKFKKSDTKQGIRERKDSRFGPSSLRDVNLFKRELIRTSGVKVGRYMGSTATLLEKFMWNEYGYVAHRTRKAVNRDKQQVRTQRGLMVQRPLFSVLLRKYSKLFNENVLNGLYLSMQTVTGQIASGHGRIKALGGMFEVGGAGSSLRSLSSRRTIREDELADVFKSGSGKNASRKAVSGSTNISRNFSQWESRFQALITADRRRWVK